MSKNRIELGFRIPNSMLYIILVMDIDDSSKWGGNIPFVQLFIVNILSINTVQNQLWQFMNTFLADRFERLWVLLLRFFMVNNGSNS
jgi:hypothetical protein